MALTRKREFAFRNLIWKSGNLYTFKYNAWQHDPQPVIIFMYAFSGTHPKTGRQWRFFQGINFTYIPRTARRRFAQEWARVYKRSNGNLRFTYLTVKRRYPYLVGATRRYFYSPAYYVTEAKHIPFEDMERVIVSTWSKDFSKKIKTSLLAKFRGVMQAVGAGGIPPPPGRKSRSERRAARRINR